MKWIIYPLTAVSYILIVLGIIFSGETLEFKYVLSGVVTLVYEVIIGVLYELFEIK